MIIPTFLPFSLFFSFLFFSFCTLVVDIQDYACVGDPFEVKFGIG